MEEEEDPMNGPDIVNESFSKRFAGMQKRLSRFKREFRKQLRHQDPACPVVAVDFKCTGGMMYDIIKAYLEKNGFTSRYCADMSIEATLNMRWRGKWSKSVGNDFHLAHLNVKRKRCEDLKRAFQVIVRAHDFTEGGMISMPVPPQPEVQSSFKKYLAQSEFKVERRYTNCNEEIVLDVSPLCYPEAYKQNIKKILSRKRVKQQEEEEEVEEKTEELIQ